jgi:type II secretory pathway pseudopilin PulG
VKHTIIAVAIVGLFSARQTAALEASNLDLVTQTAQQAVRSALTDLQLSTQSGDGGAGPVAVASASTHSANWLFEHLLVADLLSRGLDVTIDGDATTKMSWRVVDLGITGQTGLLGGTVTRRCRVVVRLELHNAGELVWSADGHAERQDRVPKGQIEALQHSRFGFAKTDLKERTWGKFVEPVILTTVLGSLVYLFFSNR